MDLDVARFLPRFRVKVSQLMQSPCERSPSDFHATLSVLLGTDEGEESSDMLRNDWARVLDMQDRVGRIPVDLEPVELFLDVDTLGISSDKQPAYLHSLVEALRAVQTIQHERSVVSYGERLHLKPFVAIWAMDLSLSHATLALPAIEELRRLVQVGVPLNNVEFPDVSPFLDTPTPDVPWRLAWCELLCAMTEPAGTHRDEVDKSSWFVRRLIVPSECLRGPLLTSLFSALVFARVIGELQLGRMVSGSTRRREAAADHGADTAAAVDPNFWYWLTCLLLPAASLASRPIETVSLLGARIQETAMRAMERIAQSRPAIHHVVMALLTEIELDPLPVGSELKTVSICAGTMLRIHEINGVKDMATMKTVTGRSLQDRRDSTPAVFIVPGLGVCSTTASGFLPIKRARVVANAISGATDLPPTNVSLKNLKFISPRRPSQSLLLLWQFVQLVGPTLQGLHISASRMTRATMNMLLQTCPRLESLSVGGARITSLDFLWDAYARGCTVSSLEIANGAARHHFDTRLSLETPALLHQSCLMRRRSHGR